MSTQSYCRFRITLHTWTAPLWAMATNNGQQQQQQQAQTPQQILEPVLLPSQNVLQQSASQQQQPSLPPSRKSTGSTKMTALQAASSDRLIAREVWLHSKEDETRDALGRMLGWVEELVSIVGKAFQSQSCYPLTCLLVSISLTAYSLLALSFRTSILDPPTAQIIPSANRTRNKFDAHKIKSPTCSS